MIIVNQKCLVITMSNLLIMPTFGWKRIERSVFEAKALPQPANLKSS